MSQNREENEFQAHLDDLLYIIDGRKYLLTSPFRKLGNDASANAAFARIAIAKCVDMVHATLKVFAGDDRYGILARYSEAFNKESGIKIRIEFLIKEFSEVGIEITEHSLRDFGALWFLRNIIVHGLHPTAETALYHDKCIAERGFPSDISQLNETHFVRAIEIARELLEGIKITQQGPRASLIARALKAVEYANPAIDPRTTYSTKEAILSLLIENFENIRAQVKEIWRVTEPKINEYNRRYASETKNMYAKELLEFTAPQELQLMIRVFGTWRHTEAFNEILPLELLRTLNKRAFDTWSEYVRQTYDLRHITHARVKTALQALETCADNAALERYDQIEPDLITVCEFNYRYMENWGIFEMFSTLMFLNPNDRIWNLQLAQEILDYVDLTFKYKPLRDQHATYDAASFARRRRVLAAYETALGS